MNRPVLLASAAISLVVMAALFSTLTNREDALALHAMPCPDVNGDGIVAGGDLIVQATYPAGMLVPPAPPSADIDGDTFVTPADTAIIVGAFGAVGLICQDSPLGLGPGAGAAANYDADGCTNVEEMAVPPLLGGSRDIYNHWDFYDVPTGVGGARDGAIAGVDFFGLLGRFGAVDGSPGKVDPPFAAVPAAPAYHSSYDRSPAVAPFFPVDLGPPDGAITGFDFFALLMQFGTDCTGPP